MTTYYPQCQNPQTCNFPLMASEWSYVENIYPAPIVPIAIPIATLTSQLRASMCPYTGALVTTESLVHTAPIIGGDFMPLICNHYSYPLNFEVNCVKEFPEIEVYSKEPIAEAEEPLTDNNYTCFTAPKLNCVKISKFPPKELENDQVQHFMVGVPKEITHEMSNKIKDKKANLDVDPVEVYLSLPKDLFPKAKMLSIDSNPIIDQLCKLENIMEHVSWILDLEFGVPRVAVTRTIATYDVKFNSIHCKNTPNAIHPGFEKCNSDFKRIILFYYDCIVSNWYNGFIILKNDKSVENFQSWLSIPMQMFGMCWP